MYEISHGPSWLRPLWRSGRTWPFALQVLITPSAQTWTWPEQHQASQVGCSAMTCHINSHHTLTMMNVAGCVTNNACSNLFCDTCILGEPVKDGARFLFQDLKIVPESQSCLQLLSFSSFSFFLPPQPNPEYMACLEECIDLHWYIRYEGYLSIIQYVCSFTSRHFQLELQASSNSRGENIDDNAVTCLLFTWCCSNHGAPRSGYTVSESQSKLHKAIHRFSWLDQRVMQYIRLEIISRCIDSSYPDY